MSTFTEWKPAASLAMFPNPSPACLRECAAAGVQAVEVYSPLLKDADEFVKLSRETGVELWSTHLPFSGELDISRGDEFAEKTVESHEEWLRIAANAGFKVAVVHPSAEPIADPDRPARLARSRENLMRLASFAKALGMRLAVEDLPRTCLGHTSDDINFLLCGNPDLGICFDTNHLLMEDNLNFVKRLGSRIITLHVSDYDFIDERHLLPGEGKNNWVGIADALEEAGYNGPWMNELSSKKGYTAADVVRAKNAIRA